VEFGEWQSGVRVEAALFAALTLSQKVATGIAAAGSGLMLELVGHSKLSPMAGAGAQAFGVMIFVAPALAIALSLLAIWRYPLSTALHARLVRALAWRRARRQR
jgi:GPH family glycoside/pentoside/hexuronide:cation symporter